MESKIDFVKMFTVTLDTNNSTYVSPGKRGKNYEFTNKKVLINSLEEFPILVAAKEESGAKMKGAWGNISPAVKSSYTPPTVKKPVSSVSSGSGGGAAATATTTATTTAPTITSVETKSVTSEKVEVKKELTLAERIKKSLEKNETKKIEALNTSTTDDVVITSFIKQKIVEYITEHYDSENSTDDDYHEEEVREDDIGTDED